MAMPILHVLAPSPVGGLERVVQTLAAEQTASGEEVHVAAVVSRGERRVADAFLAPLSSAGVRTHALELPPRGYSRERAALIDLCRRHRPAIVHTHGYRADLVDGSVARSVNAAAVTTVHGFTGGGARNRCYEWLQRRAFRRFDAVVAVSKPIVQRVVNSGVSADRVHLVINAWRPSTQPLAPVAARAALGIAPRKFAIGWAGRVSHEKGLDVLIDALAMLKPLPFQLSVIGDGPERAALEQRARNLGIGERIRWHGFVPNADALFTGFDAFVLSSRTEGTPMVLFEALASAVPIIATSVGGVPDLLRQDESTLVEPERPEALASAIRQLFEQPCVARVRAGVARERMNGSDQMGPWIDGYNAAYRAALSASGKR